MTSMEELLIEQEEHVELDVLHLPEHVLWEELGSHALEVHRWAG